MARVRYLHRVRAAPHVAGIAPPVNTVAPVITGDTAGEESSVSDGTWTGSPAFTYQWFLDGVAITDETEDAITTDAGWVGQTLSAVVYGANGAGIAAASSNSVVLQEGSEYTGPLDLVPGATVACGQRAMKAADLGTAVYTITENYDDTSQGFNSDAVTGAAPVASIQSFRPANFNKTGAVIQDDTSIVLVSATHVAVNQPITGADIPSSTVVIDTSGPPTIGVSAAPTGTNPAEALTFTPALAIATWNDKSGNGLNLSGDVADGCLWQVCSSNSLPGFAGSYASSLTETAASISVSAATPLSFFLPLFIGTGNDGNIRITLGDGSAQVQFYVDRLSTEVIITDGMTPVTWDSAGAYAGLHLFEFHIDAAGALVVLKDGVSVSSAIVDGSQHAIYPMTASFKVQAGLNLASDEVMIFEPLLYLSALSAGNKTALRENIATYYGITL